MRNKMIGSMTMFVAALSAVAMAQTMTQTTAQKPPAGAAQPVAAAIRSSWDGAKKNVAESAEVMPEANYNFKPVDTVRSFGAILSHLAGANYVFCSAAKGEASPHAEDEFEKSATTRPAIIKALGDSHAYCDAVFASATDRSLAEIVDMPFGMPRAPRTAALLAQIGHVNEHYGNLVTYFRIKGIVPPSSRR